MRSEIKERFSDQILQKACRQHGLVNPEALEHGENHVFKAELGSTPIVLRLSHSIRRSPERLNAELDWLEYLSKAGEPVAAPVRTQSKLRLAVIDDGFGGSFYSACFEFADGESVDEDSEISWNDDLFREWGYRLGSLHRCAKEYQTKNTVRNTWEFQDKDWIEQHLPKDDFVQEQWASLLAKLRQLPRGASDFGLIHADLAPWNFTVNQGKLTLFDFDSSMYAWFAYDLAICLYYAMPSSDDDLTREEAAHRFFAPFVSGYREAGEIEKHWFEWLEDFLLLQTFYLLASIHSSDVVGLDDEQWAHYRDLFFDRIRGIRPVVPIKELVAELKSKYA